MFRVRLLDLCQIKPVRLPKVSAGFNISPQKVFFFTFSHFFVTTVLFGIFCLVWYERGSLAAVAALGGAGEGLG